MAEPYIGEIRLVGFSFAPIDWAFCNGALLAISQNNTLYQLIGTTYGGDGQSTFALPNLLSRTPIHQGTNPTNGTNYILGQVAGEEQITLTAQQMPNHNHLLVASSNPGTANSPGGNILASSPELPYSVSAPNVSMAPVALGISGNNQPHTNISPYLAINFIIALIGTYPSAS